MPTGWEWAVLVLIALLLFGGARLSGVGRNVGSAVREFTDAASGGNSANPADVETQNEREGEMPRVGGSADAHAPRADPSDTEIA